MNLFPARLGGAVTCEIQPFADALPEEQCVHARELAGRGVPFFVGIRPEHLSLVPSGSPSSFEAEVEVVEPLGQTTNLYLRHNAVGITVVTGRTAVRVRETIGVRADPVHLRVVEEDPPAGR